MVVRAAMQHCDRCHPLRGNGKHHKPDQYGSEQLPHDRTLQELPRPGQRLPDQPVGVDRADRFNPVFGCPECALLA